MMTDAIIDGRVNSGQERQNNVSTARYIVQRSPRLDALLSRVSHTGAWAACRLSRCTDLDNPEFAFLMARPAGIGADGAKVDCYHQGRRYVLKARRLASGDWAIQRGHRLPPARQLRDWLA
jgi:hypothetical protein